MSPWNKLIPNWFSKLVLKNSDNNDHETNKTNSCFAQSEIPERRMTHPITGQVLLRLTAIKKDVGQHVVYQYETTSLTNPQLLIAICSNRELYGQPCKDCVTSLELKIYISENNSNNSSISYQKQIEACRLCGLLDYFSSEQAAWTYLIEFLDGGEGYVKQHVARLDIGCLLELNEKRMIENFIVKKSATMSSEELVSYCVSCCHESMISDENVTEFHFDELKLFKSKFNINLRRKWMKIVYKSQELEYEECLIEDMPFLCYNTLIFNGEMILKSIFSFNTHFLEQVPEYSQDLVFKIDKRHFRHPCVQFAKEILIQVFGFKRLLLFENNLVSSKTRPLLKAVWTLIMTQIHVPEFALIFPVFWPQTSELPDLPQALWKIMTTTMNNDFEPETLHDISITCKHYTFENTDL